MSSGAGTNTVSSQSQPPAAFQAALGQVGQQAQQTAQTPYQPYTGQLVAPMNAQQYAGIQNMDTAYQYGQPYQTAAGNEIAASTAPLLPGAQPYLDQAGSLYGMAANNAASLSGYVQPGIGQANSLYGASAQQLTPTQFSAGQVNQYESPYTQQVVNATQAQFNNQNQQQQSSIAGNAISQGAFGGDREGVAQGIAAGQEQLAQAPVIAGLQNQGYAQALNEFNTQQQVGLGAQQATQQLQQGAGAGILAGGNQMLNAQQLATQDLQSTAQGTAGLGQTALGANEANAWLNSQAGFGYANLGNQAYNQILSTGQAGLAAGNQEQQQQQSELNVPYEQYIQQQGYPFQVESWLSGLEGQLSNAAGGTASTTSPGPSPISQIGGLGLTGLAGYGLLNNAGLLGGAASTAGPSAAALLAAPSTGAGIIGAGGAGFLGTAATAAEGALPAFERGGATPKHAGGGIIAFPSRTRPGIGAGANDNMHPMGMPRKLAVGGGILRRADSGAIPDDDTDMPIPPIPSQQGGIGSMQPAAGGIGTTASAPSTHVPWETLLAAGLSIMGGSSPNASVNIGRGGMQGLQWGEQQRAIQERENLARTTQEQQAKYQTGELGLRGQQLQQTGELTKAQMAQTAAHQQAELAQQLAIQKMQIGMEGARLAEERAYHQQSLTPSEVRIFDAYNKMSPDEQNQFRQMKMSEKGLTDIFGSPTGNTVVPPGAPSGAAPPTGADFIKTLNPAAQSQVKALAEGRMAMPTRPNPQQQQLILAASQYDPTFDATDFNKRNKTASDFASGQSAKAVTSINTATSHLSSLSDQMDALHNGDIPLVNSISNWIKTNTGQSAPTTATETRDAVANELRKVFATTGGGGLEELKEWQSHFPINGSPTQQKDAIRQAVDLMQPRMESLAHQWNTGMGTNHQGLDLLSPGARDSWQKLTGAVPATADASAPTYNRPGGKPSSGTMPPQGQAGAAAWKYTAVGQGGSGMIHSNDGAHWFTPDGKPFGEP